MQRQPSNPNVGLYSIGKICDLLFHFKFERWMRKNRAKVLKLRKVSARVRMMMSYSRLFGAIGLTLLSALPFRVVTYQGIFKNHLWAYQNCMTF